MNLGDFVMNIRGSLTMDDVAPITCTNFSPDVGQPSFEELVSYCANNGLNVKCLHKTKIEAFLPFWYIDEPLFFNFPNLNFLSQYMRQSRTALIKAWDSKDYAGFYTIIESKFRFFHFSKHFRELPLCSLFDVFGNVYTSVENGFTMLSMDDYRFIFDHAPKQRCVNRTEKIVIWRGVGAKSLTLDQTISWTTDEKVARGFANRFRSSGSLILAQSYRENVIEMNTPEAEVLVLPEHVQVLKKVRL